MGTTPLNVIKIKDGNQWTTVPALKGTSVYLQSVPTTFNRNGQSGWEWTFKDEKTQDSYHVEVYNGAAGSSLMVDGTLPSNGINIDLKAITYNSSQSSLLTSAQKSYARANISAMELLPAVESQIPYFNGTAWAAADITSVLNMPSESSSYVLNIIDSQTYSWSAIPVISEAAIEQIVSGSSVFSTLNINRNGTYNAQQNGFYGYSVVTAAVPTGFSVTSASNSTGNTATISVWTVV